jgi:hypothetical protein
MRVRPKPRGKWIWIEEGALLPCPVVPDYYPIYPWYPVSTGDGTSHYVEPTTTTVTNATDYISVEADKPKTEYVVTVNV